MQRLLTLSQKTGFKILQKNIPVIIRDNRGIIFYSNEFIAEDKRKFFNLPFGRYIVDSGYFAPMANPVKYKLIHLPPKQRNFPKPFDFKIEFNRNPHKCTVHWDKKLIVFDNSFRDTPRFILEFVLYHEIAHHAYHTEKYADALASNFMLLRGYNPSQVGIAPLFSLSSVQEHRKKFIINNLIN